jgi:2-aminoadipate transaminase
MNFDRIFSENSRNLQASEIRELLKLLDRPSIISFAGGLPNPDAFPIEELKPVIEHVMKEHAYDALQYGPTEGHNKLRDAIAKGMKSLFNCDQEMDNIIITGGSQQGLTLLAHIIIDPGDTVITGNPTYLGAIQVFNAFRANIEAVAQDEGGINHHSLRERLQDLNRRGKYPKLIYLIPTFENPTGITLSEERRKAIYDIICEYDLLLVEDDPYGLLRYDGEALNPIKSMDNEDRVIYLGSFSKILAPGFRIAWLAGPAPIIRKACILKQSQDLCASTFGQYCVFEAMRSDMLFPHIEIIKQMYRSKRDIMLKALDNYMPDGVKWSRPLGGMFIWVTLPLFMDSVELLPKAIENNVAYVAGKSFFPGGGGANTLRLNFSYATDGQIDRGIRLLAEVVQKELDLKGKGLKGEYISAF